MLAGPRRLLLASALLAPPAFAQDPAPTGLQNGFDGDINLVRPFFGPTTLPGIDVPVNERGGSARWGIVAMYTNNPMVLYEDRDDVRTEIGAVINHRISAFAGVSVDISRAFTARLSVPMYFQFGTEVPKYASEGFAFGDINVGAHWAFFRKPAVGLGLRLDMSLPTARRNFYAGETLPYLNPAFLMMFDVGRVRIASDLGANIRFRDIDTKTDLNLSHELVWNAGVRVNVLRERLDVGLGLYSRFGFANFGGAGETSGEFLVNVAYRAAPFLWVDLAAGRGFSEGYGASDFRTWLQLRFQKIRKAKPGDPDFIDPDGGPKGDEGGLIFNGRDVGTFKAEGEGDTEPEETWGDGEFAKIESERIRIRYAINFKVGTDQLLPESYPTLDYIADLLNNDARIAHVVIEGHSSEDGAFDANYKLSINRAASIWRRVVEQGVHPSRISFRGMGEVMPAEATGGYDELQASRRVVFHIVRQYEEWETSPTYDLDLKYPWNGDEYRAKQPKMPSIDEMTGMPDLVRPERVEDTLKDLTFEDEDEEPVFDQEAAPNTPEAADEESP